MKQMRRGQSSGFTVWEMLIVITLLGSTSMLIPRLFGSSLRVFREAPVARDQIVRYEAMIHALRADAWNAQDVLAQDKSCDFFGKTPVQWKIDSQPEGVEIVRSQESDVRRWMFPSSWKFSFKANDSGVTLLIDSAARNDSIVLASEVRQINREAGK